MKFAYVAAALLGLAYGNPALSEAPETDSLALLEAREIVDLTLLDERDGDVALFDAFDDEFNIFEEREADAAFDDVFEDEETELEARSASSILSSLKKVDAQIKNVNSKLNKIGKNSKPSNAQALAVRSAAAKLSSAVNAATSAANGSGKLSKGDSKKVFAYVSKTLKPATINSLQNFINHKGAFKKGGFTGIVKQNLQQLKGQTNSLGNALIAKAGSAAIKKKGKALNNQIQAKFAQAIKAF